MIPEDFKTNAAIQQLLGSQIYVPTSNNFSETKDFSPYFIEKDGENYITLFTNLQVASNFQEEMQCHLYVSTASAFISHVPPEYGWLINPNSDIFSISVPAKEIAKVRKIISTLSTS